MSPYREAEGFQALPVPDKYHQTSMSECDPKRHRAGSSITANSYAPSYLIRSEERVDKRIQELWEQLQNLARIGEAFHFDKWLNYVASVGELTFSTRLGFAQRRRHRQLHSQHAVSHDQAVMGYMYWLHPFILHSPFAGYLGLNPDVNLFETTWPPSGSVTIENGPDRMEEPEILAVAGMTTIAGSETMTGALASMFYFILKNPDCMAKLKQELKKAHVAGQLSPVVQYEEAKNFHISKPEYFAYAEIGKITATVLRDFDIELEKPETEWEHRSHFTIAQWNWPVKIRQAVYAA
ncbi:uncharacterized protein ATNIH1004_007933 [Aspergillus tanneri]|uniref:Cytochrome P450 n=1 Tax=Aspergillus tanneri TaxID=1220188 RepID=A0A5M9MMI3_9EURO|nr:uncharacterized protein ATNIH1004_007933 [Aspergillus tanneri]KAA8646500.1 hypothetical protein ATNIH1004_007933 [Aspergillus tanneri]